MASNDLFRMVSLRHSKASPRRSGPASDPDPRLRHRRLLDGQAAMVSSPRETKLQELKGRHAELSKKVVQLESVQRAVIDAYMLERQDEPIPGAKSVAQVAEAPIVAARPVAGAAGSSTSTIIAERGRFIKRVEKRLSAAGTALFRDVISGVM